MINIIASLTTTPNRVNLILPIIESIIKQTIPINKIEINIPYVLKRTGESYEIPEWLTVLEQDSKNTKCEIEIFRTEDYGPITKIVPTLIRHRNSKNTYIWSLDDDLKYPENMLAVLYREFSLENNYVLSHSGGVWLYDDRTAENRCYCHHSQRNEGFVEYVEGFSSVLYPAFVFEDDLENYIIKTSESLDCILSDDIIISNYLRMKHIKMYNCSYPYNYDRPLFENGHMPHAKNEDALHNQNGGNNERYNRVFHWLKKENLNAWSSQSPIIK